MSDISSTLLASPLLSAEQAGSLTKGKTCRHHPAKIPAGATTKSVRPFQGEMSDYWRTEGVREEVISRQS